MDDAGVYWDIIGEFLKSSNFTVFTCAFFSPYFCSDYLCCDFLLNLYVIFQILITAAVT
jgi:hypothetical protein